MPVLAPRLSPRLATVLLRSTVLGLLPLLFLCLWLSYQYIQTPEQETLYHAKRRAETYAQGLDHYLEQRLQALTLLSHLPHPQNRQHLPLWQQQLQHYQQQFGQAIWLLRSDTQAPIVAQSAPNKSRPPALDHPSLRVISQRGSAGGVGTMLMLAPPTLPMLPLLVPLAQTSAPRAVLLTLIDGSQLAAPLQAQPLPQDWGWALEDQEGHTIASDAQAYSQHLDVSAAVTQGPWRVHVFVPLHQIASPRQRLALGLLAALLLGCVLACASVYRRARHLAEAVRQLDSIAPTAQIAELDELQQRFSEQKNQHQYSEQQRQSVEYRFQRLFFHAPIPMGVVNQQGLVVALNQQFEQVLGYTVADLPQPDSWWHLAYPDADYRQWVLRDWFRDVQHAQEQRTILPPKEYRVCCKNGEQRVFGITAIPLPEGTLAIFIDITQQHKQETLLKDAQRMAKLGHWHWDLNTGQVQWSEEMYRLFGRDPVLGPATIETVPRYFTPQSWAQLEHAVQTAIEQGQCYELDVELIYTEHSRRWAHARGEPSRDAQGRTIALHGMMQDISERKFAEAQLRASEQRLQIFINHSPAALAMFDTHMCYLAVSRRWQDDYGLSPASILGLNHYQVFPDTSEEWKTRYQRGLNGEILRAEQDRFIRHDGQERCLRWEIRPWHTDKGSIGGIVIFSEDITSYQRIQDEIKALNSNLEQRVQERTQELQAANRELDAFVSAACHDLRAPLRIMTGFAQATLEDYGSHLPTEGQNYLQQIRHSAEHMTALLDGLFSLSRSTLGDLLRDVVNVSQLAEVILRELTQSDSSRPVSYHIEADLHTWGDVRMVELILRNLLGNAWKYTSQAPQAHIRVYQEQKDGRTWICIHDNGVGFAEHQVARLFQPFQRLHHAHEFPGLGLGLATVQRIVSRHGGEIRAQGSPGVGACFAFHLNPTFPTFLPGERTS